jgi:hypothetical protein
MLIMQPRLRVSCLSGQEDHALTEEYGETDKRSDVEYFEVLEPLAVHADKGGHHEDCEESDGQPKVGESASRKARLTFTNMVVTRLRSVSKATPTRVGK